MASELMRSLAEPFPPQDIDWRIGQAGKKQNGEIWCKVLAYLNARAVMDRLDAVVGPENWRPEFTTAPNDPEGKSVLCTLYLRINDEWIGKSDAASNSDIEPVKGGISDALKRAAVQWGIGRYLYGLSENWAEIVDQKEKGSHYANCKIKNKGTEEWIQFNWFPPRLPEWAMPQIPNDNPPREQPKAKQPTPQSADATPPGDSPKDAVSKKVEALAFVRSMVRIEDAGKVRKRVVELQRDKFITTEEADEIEKAVLDQIAKLTKMKRGVAA